MCVYNNRVRSPAFSVGTTCKILNRPTRYFFMHPARPLSILTFGPGLFWLSLTICMHALKAWSAADCYAGTDLTFDRTYTYMSASSWCYQVSTNCKLRLEVINVLCNGIMCLLYDHHVILPKMASIECMCAISRTFMVCPVLNNMLPKQSMQSNSADYKYVCYQAVACGILTGWSVILFPQTVADI